MSDKKTESKPKTAKKKGYFLKEKFFADKKKYKIKDEKQVLVDIDEHTILFEGVPIVFKKGEPVSAGDLKLMSSYQKSFYLNQVN